MNRNIAANKQDGAPPLPVTKVNGFYYFIRARGLAMAYAGQYARDFAAWADLPAIEGEAIAEPSHAEFEALLRGKERKL